MQKHRVFCPHCAVSLLVTEDLFGTVADCPGCHQAFQLPARASGSARPLETPPAELHYSSPDPIAPAPRPAQPDHGIPSLFSLQEPAHRNRSGGKELRIESRPALRLAATLLKVLAGIQVAGGCLILVAMLVISLRKHPGTESILLAIVAGLAVGLGAIPTLAFSELILVVNSQDEMLRHIVNQLRSRE
jgi:hypothetical protein